MEKIICEKCGHEMVDKSSGPYVAVECPNCGHGWTTYDFALEDEIVTDDTVYSVTLLKNDSTIEKIKCVSCLSGKNYIESKNILINGGELISGFAPHIKNVKSELEKGGILFKISPDYKY